MHSSASTSSQSPTHVGVSQSRLAQAAEHTCVRATLGPPPSFTSELSTRPPQAETARKTQAATPCAARGSLELVDSRDTEVVVEKRIIVGRPGQVLNMKQDHVHLPPDSRGGRVIEEVYPLDLAKLDARVRIRWAHSPRKHAASLAQRSSESNVRLRRANTRVAGTGAERGCEDQLLLWSGLWSRASASRHVPKRPQVEVSRDTRSQVETRVGVIEAPAVRSLQGRRRCGTPPGSARRSLLCMWAYLAQAVGPLAARRSACGPGRYTELQRPARRPNLVAYIV